MAMVVDDTIVTVTGKVQTQFVEQRSRFISFIWPVTSADEVKERINALQKEYYDARHCCYAYMIGAERTEWRANDNGEPSGTAGKPILGQINSAGLTNVLIAVVRYFGGVKLGTSGLTEAYRMAAAQVIDKAQKVTLLVCRQVELLFHYDMMNQIMRMVKEVGVEVKSQDWGEFTLGEVPHQGTFECRMLLRVRLKELVRVEEQIKRIIVTLPQAGIAYRIDEYNQINY